MTPQLIAMLEADASLMIFALFVIAFGVLRLQPRQMVTAPALPLAPRVYNTSDVIYIDAYQPGAGVAIHSAERHGYRFVELNGTIRTYFRTGRP